MNLASVLATVEPEATVVTATRRLARQVREFHDRHQTRQDRKAWRPIDAIPWDSWLERSWQRLRDRGRPGQVGMLLSPEQERLAWEHAVAGLGDPGAVLMPSQVAREAEEAWALIRTYAISTDEVRRQAGTDTRHFLQAASSFAERCRERGWRTRSELPGRLNAAAGQVAADNPYLILLGFDALPPAHEALVTALSAAGSRVECPAPVASQPQAHTACMADPETELRAMAAMAGRWCAGSPEARVGIVLMDMERRRGLIEDVFADVLVPQRIVPGTSDHARPYDLSLGEPLSHWPVIDAALLALRLWLEPGSSTDVGRLLRSPFIGGARGEGSARAALDAWLRQNGFYELALSDLLRILEHGHEPTRPDCPLLARHIRTALEAQAEPDKRQSLSAWAPGVARFLSALGWPGEHALDSAEYQTVDKWRSILDRLASLDPLVGDANGRNCVERLSRLATDTVFQPESTSAPIQILGLLETTGLEFDALWVGGMHHQAWPRPLRPNPLLPGALQRRCGMPRASVSSELAFARLMTERLAGAAPHVVFSWPRQEADEVLRVSSLIATLPSIEIEPPAADLWARRQLDSGTLETITDIRLPALPSGHRVRGGTSIIKSQSACPFQAQARFRLGAAPLDTPGPGITAIQRGQISHRALQWLWSQWRGLDGMLGVPATERDRQIMAAVARAARETVRHLSHLDERLSRLECERLTLRIRELLEADASRAPFRIETIERDRYWSLAGLRLRMRADRVDRLADGRLLYVDYKTGAAAAGDWLGARPNEPQLPLYALASPIDVAGIAFGSLAAGEVGYRGLAQEDIAGTDIVTPAASRAAVKAGLDAWDKLLVAWRQRLTEIASEFVAGEAGVRPRRIVEDCRYCHLSVLCRRHELAERGVLIDA